MATAECSYAAGSLLPQSFLQAHAAFSVVWTSLIVSEKAIIFVTVSNIHLATTTDISPFNQIRDDSSRSFRRAVVTRYPDALIHQNRRLFVNLL
jgi:hypothetical protein